VVLVRVVLPADVVLDVGKDRVVVVLLPGDPTVSCELPLLPM
jgi:hypothetical protein